LWSAQASALGSEAAFEDGIDLLGEGIEVRLDGGSAAGGRWRGGWDLDGAAGLGEVRAASSAASTGISSTSAAAGSG
jgi:hypothetical protein